MKTTSIKPQDINPILQDKETAEIKQSTKLAKILARPQLKMDDLLQLESINSIWKKTKPPKRH